MSMEQRKESGYANAGSRDYGEPRAVASCTYRPLYTFDRREISRQVDKYVWRCGLCQQYVQKSRKRGHVNHKHVKAVAAREIVITSRNIFIKDTCHEPLH
jgi:hypothetical protein